ncbi:MAG: pilus assembly PilX N-terminal domain-containing protein [Gammaproteobacteria bacterium]|nr:pilus assembly PilX N-terminal domain-containing protein [Gammaproteobacteria bacterium]
MRLRETNLQGKQGGAVLVITMLFLVAISVLAVTSMQSSNVGLYMAQNEESRIAAAQGAQALADNIVANPAATPVVGGNGFTICTPGEANCDRTDLPVANGILATSVAKGHISARVVREGPLFRPPPRSVESSIDKFNSASFEVVTTYDRTSEQLGRQQITEGVLVLVPKF